LAAIEAKGIGQTTAQHWERQPKVLLFSCEQAKRDANLSKEPVWEASLPSPRNKNLCRSVGSKKGSFDMDFMDPAFAMQSIK
jgi:hypothetical protein